MGLFEYKTSFSDSELLISASEFIELYLFGLPLTTIDGSETLTNETIEQKILASQAEVETWLNIKFKKQIIKETRDFNREEFGEWGYIKTTFPIIKPFELKGYLNQMLQMTYPVEWLCVNKGDGVNANFRQLHIIPTSQSAQTSSAIYYGMLSQIGLLNANNLPNFWHVVYCTGMDVVPRDIVNYIGKLAACQVLAILGNILLGPGISSQSLSIDGLAQDIGSTNSSMFGAYSSRISQYQKEMKDMMQRMEMKYRGIAFMSV